MAIVSAPRGSVEGQQNAANRQEERVTVDVLQRMWLRQLVRPVR